MVQVLQSVLWYWWCRSNNINSISAANPIFATSWPCNNAEYLIDTEKNTQRILMKAMRLFLSTTWKFSAQINANAMAFSPFFSLYLAPSRSRVICLKQFPFFYSHTQFTELYGKNFPSFFSFRICDVDAQCVDIYSIHIIRRLWWR